MYKIIIFIMTFLITGCGNPAMISKGFLNNEELKNESTEMLCKMYGYSQSGVYAPERRYRIELDSRNEISQKDWSYIEKRWIYIGMSKTSVYCSLGPSEKIGLSRDNVEELFFNLNANVYFTGGDKVVIYFKDNKIIKYIND